MNIWDEVLKLSEKAAKKGEVPVGAVMVVDKSKIIAKGYNKREKKHNILGHAEIEIIKKTNKRLRTWKLDNCELYVSLKPCSMCETIIRQSRIKNVYYLLEKDEKKKEFYNTNFENWQNETYQKKYKEILANFFKKMR